jgi:hypothetical protein
MERPLCSWVRGINVIKRVKFQKEIYRCNGIPIKISMTFFIDIEKYLKNSYGSTKDHE